MNKTNPMLLIDFYKAVHAEILPQNITKSVSYFTPRMSRVKRWDKVVMFGLQGFMKTYLIDYFNEEFFFIYTFYYGIDVSCPKFNIILWTYLIFLFIIYKFTNDFAK